MMKGTNQCVNVKKKLIEEPFLPLSSTICMYTEDVTFVYPLSSPHNFLHGPKDAMTALQYTISVSRGIHILFFSSEIVFSAVFFLC